MKFVNDTQIDIKMNMGKGRHPCAKCVFGKFIEYDNTPGKYYCAVPKCIKKYDYAIRNIRQRGAIKTR